MRIKRLKLAKIYQTKRIRFMAFAVAALLIFSFVTFSLSSYIYSATMNTYIATAVGDFYFTSDLLTDAATVPTYHITHDWQTDATISFKLKNYENQLNISDRQISYTATASATGSSTASGTIDPGSGGQSKTVSLIVPAPEDKTESLDVLVTAASTSPYAKTLQGRFIISPDISCEMAVNTASSVAILNISLSQSAQLTKAVTIAWPAGAAPDMTNPIVMNASSIDLTGRTLTTTLNTAAKYELVFFKDLVDNGYEYNYSGVTVTGA